MASRLLLLALVAAAVAVPPASAAVASIDLGSEWLKVAAVHLAPGRAPIAVAINEMSKRKSPALAALADGNRLAGEEAAGITARHPSKVFSRMRDLLAKPFPYARALADSLFLPYDLVQDARGAAAVRADDGQVYSVEEIVAMVLHYASGIADAHVGLPVRDAVVAVPPYFGQAERRALTQAAQLAGFNVLTLVNEHAGAALQYGIDKDFSNESRHGLGQHLRHARPLLVLQRQGVREDGVCAQQATALCCAPLHPGLVQVLVDDDQGWLFHVFIQLVLPRGAKTLAWGDKGLRERRH